ncbi:MAG: hypothetical protein AAF251_01630 [Pseudomonadota bacterium]
MFDIILGLAAASASCVPAESRPEDLAQINATSSAIRSAFAERDVEGIARYHHDNVIKSLGPGQYYEGKKALKAQLSETFGSVALKFGEGGQRNREALMICGESAISITLFEIAFIPDDGSEGGVFAGRTMVVMVRSKDAPHGWVVFSELIQPQ